MHDSGTLLLGSRKTMQKLFKIEFDCPKREEV
jgi:hypothetical protein